MHNENSNIEKANRVNCDDQAERIAPSSQQPHLLSENYLRHYVHVQFEIHNNNLESVARLLESEILGHPIMTKSKKLNIQTQTKIIQGPK